MPNKKTDAKVSITYDKAIKIARMQLSLMSVLMSEAEKSVAKGVLCYYLALLFDSKFSQKDILKDLER